MRPTALGCSFFRSPLVSWQVCYCWQLSLKEKKIGFKFHCSFFSDKTARQMLVLANVAKWQQYSVEGNLSLVWIIWLQTFYDLNSCKENGNVLRHFLFPTGNIMHHRSILLGCYVFSNLVQYIPQKYALYDSYFTTHTEKEWICSYNKSKEGTSSNQIIVNLSCK